MRDDYHTAKESPKKGVAKEMSIKWKRKNQNKNWTVVQVSTLNLPSLCDRSHFNQLALSFLPQDEIFDMVKPKDPLKISLQDLINSNQGDTVTTILIDLNGFWTYENREALVANDNENSADLDDT